MEFNYKQLEKNVHSLKLPNQKWTTIVDPGDRIMFLRIDEGYRSYLSVSVNSELNMNVYYRSEKLKWIKCDKPQEQKDIENILETVNKIIFSESMYTQD